MGLDMYLYKRHYIGNKFRKPKQQVRVVVPKNQKGVLFPTGDINNARISEVTEMVAYWRKANQIHRWFVENVQDGKDDCEKYSVDAAKLQELMDVCTEVLEASKLFKGKVSNGRVYANGKWKPVLVDGKVIKDPSVAQELLPTQDGFFFGGDGYDEYYLSDIKETKEMLLKLLEEDPKGSGDYYYQASW